MTRLILTSLGLVLLATAASADCITICKPRGALIINDECVTICR